MIANPLRRRDLLQPRRAHMPNEALVTGAESDEIGRCLSQAQLAVGSAENLVCVGIVLAIILPKTDPAE